MVFHPISKDIKDRALWLLGEGFIDEDIAALLGVSTRSISQWKNNFEQYGSVIMENAKEIHMWISRFGIDLII